MEAIQRKVLKHESDAFDALDSAAEADYDVVQFHNASAVDSMTDAQRGKVRRFYELLANAMPLESRDYYIEFAPLPDGKSVSARVVGKNELGRAFAKQAAEYYRRFANNTKA